MDLGFFTPTVDALPGIGIDLFPQPPNPFPLNFPMECGDNQALDARAKFPDQTLADLYDPLAMPKPLRDAHRALDRAVDRCYRNNPFDSERARVEFLFDLYQKLTAPLTAPGKGKKRRPPPPDEE